MGYKDWERNKETTISKRGRIFLAAWTVALLILSAIGGYSVADQFKKEASEHEQNITEFSIDPVRNRRILCS